MTRRPPLAFAAGVLAGRRFRLLVLAGTLALLGSPVSTSASTTSEPPPRPCVLGTSTLEAGTPLSLSGTRSSDEPVGVMAKRTDGKFMDVPVVASEGTWRAVLLFATDDGGSWMVEIVVDGGDCVNPLTVTLPTGVTPPPVLLAGSEPPLDQSASVIDWGSIRAVAVLVAVVVIVGSWLFLALLALARVFGARPLARRRLRVIARVAVFAGVLGAGLAIWAFIYFEVGMLYFDPGIPSDQQAVLDRAFWVVLVLGSVLGTLGARRLGGPSAPEAQR